MIENVKENKPKSRIEWIDITRSLLIFFVVIIHALRIGYFEVFFTSFCVPSFFILSGITFKRKEYCKDLIKKIKRLYVPYFVFGFVSVVMYYFVGSSFSSTIDVQVKDTSLVPNFLGLLYGNWKTGYMNWNTPLYYLPLCFSTKIVTNVFENLISKIEKNRLLRMIYIFVCFVVSYFITNNPDFYLPLSFEQAFFYSALMEFGILMKSVYTKKYDNKLLIILLIPMFVIGYIVSIKNYPYSIQGFYLGKNYILFIINVINLFSALVFLSKLLKNNYVFNLVGRNTIGILCMHKFPVLFFTAYIPFVNKQIINPKEDTILRNMVAISVALISIALCLIAIFVIDNICPYILGENKKKNIFRKNC